MADQAPEHDYLKRLPKEAYCGCAYVHWTQTIDNRKTGWLDETFHLKFREILAHATFKYHLSIPVYCLMPDHFHLIAIGNHHDETDQRVAMKWIRKQINWVLDGKTPGLKLQKQAYDSVLREKDRERDAFAVVCNYIRENPRRAGLISEKAEYSEWPYSGCVVAGYPEIKRDEMENRDFWDLFWKLYYREVEKNGGAEL